MGQGEDSGLYCTNIECLREIPAFYKVLSEENEVLDFGLCYPCALEVQRSFRRSRIEIEKGGLSNGE